MPRSNGCRGAPAQRVGAAFHHGDRVGAPNRTQRGQATAASRDTEPWARVPPARIAGDATTNYWRFPVITDEEVMRLFERADPARSADAESVFDAASYLDALRARGAEMAPVESQPTDNERAGHRQWRVFAAAAAAAALIVATIVLVRTETNDGGTVQTAAGPGPSAPAAPSARSPLPDGTTLLPPAGATPSAPETGQLLAPLVIPIWVYEDGRVISARWTTHTSWTGFLEQRLTPEGVELVRAEMLALHPVSFVDYVGNVLACDDAAGNYGCGYGPRSVRQSPGDWAPTNTYAQDPPCERLSELPYGAASWLPASAWADPEPKPYIPSTYLIRIAGRGPLVGGISNPTPIADTTAMLAALPTRAAELLTNPGPCPPAGDDIGVCYQVTTAVARQVATAVGITDAARPNDSPSAVRFADYAISLIPYLPHGAPVECCWG